MGYQLCPIHQKACAILVGNPTDGLNIIKRAEDVGGAAHRHDANPPLPVPAVLVVITQEPFQFIQIHKTFIVHQQPDWGSARDVAPGKFIGMVLQERVDYDRLCVFSRVAA